MPPLSISSSPSGFCLFCYKSTKSSLENRELTELTRQFSTNLSRFIQTYEANSLLIQNVSLEKLCSVDNLVKCCVSCKGLVEDFCEKYKQLKILEMELDWKIYKLMEKVNHANIVPARWVHVSLVLEDKFLRDSEKMEESGNAIKKFRQNFLNAGRQRKKLVQPRVVLQRKGKKSKSTDHLSSAVNSKDATNYNIDNFTRTQILEKKFDWKKFKEIYKDLKCTECTKQLTTFKGLRVHLQSHKDESEWDYECPQCEKKFTCSINLTRHLRTHTGERPYECQFCGVEFRYRECFKKHLKAYHENEKGVKNELVRRGGGNFKRKNKFALKQMRKGVNLEEDSEEISENEEEREEDSELDEETDDLVETTTFPDSDNEDDDLGQEIGNLENKIEMNEDVDKMNIEEEDTTAVFKDPLLEVKVEPMTREDGQNLVENIGNEETTTITAYCENKERGKSKEARAKDIPGSFRNGFCCKFCQKRFRRISQLNKHLYIDTCPEYLSEDENGIFVDSKVNKTTKKLICPKCGKQLKTRLGLNLHLKLHTRITPEHTCKGCGHDFATKQSLKLHVPKCKGESTAKMFKCLYCKCKYTSRSYLRKHMAKLHWKGKRVEGGRKRKEGRFKEGTDLDLFEDSNEDFNTQIGEVEIELKTEVEPTCSVVPTQRYSLREKRSSTYLNADEMDTDEEDKHEDGEYGTESSTTGLYPDSAIPHVELGSGQVGFGRKRARKDDLKKLVTNSLLKLSEIGMDNVSFVENENVNDGNYENGDVDERKEADLDKREVEDENTFGRGKDSFGDGTFVHLEDLD